MIVDLKMSPRARLLCPAARWATLLRGGRQLGGKRSRGGGMALRGGGERTSALALLLGDVLAAHARGDLPLVAHLAEGADLRRALLGHVELEVLPGVALRAPLQKHLARKGLQAQEEPLARGLVVLGARGHHVEAQYGAPVRGLPRGQRGARALPADVVRAEAGVVVVPQDPPVDPLVGFSQHTRPCGRTSLNVCFSTFV